MTIQSPSALRERHLFSDGPKRILALDGGGIRGIISLAFLERIERLLRERTGNPELRLADYFDLIGGTSTGAIIAAGLALGNSAQHLIDLYLTLSSKGFQKRGLLGGMLAPKFQAKALAETIRSQFGSETLGSQNLCCGLGIVAKRLDSGSVWLFHNHPRGPYFGPRDNSSSATPNRDLLIANLLRASTAAPTYFEPELIEVARGVRGAFVDGGASPHNNPALLMLMLATLKGYGFRWPLGADRLMVVSVGTGSPPFKRDAEKLSSSPAALMAVEALRSIMQDCNWLGQALMQWMSDTQTPWPIDSEVGDLAGDRLAEKPLVHYLRYDAFLDADWLERRLGLRLSREELLAIQTMDRPDLANRYLEVGRSAAQALVSTDHFPAGFDSC
jgi:uncharacterized protein